MNEARRPAGAILQTVAQYYSNRIEQFGATAAGVDWNSRESQELRFAQLLRVVRESSHTSLIDFGCGYGALADLLAGTGREWQYCGYDISDAMIARAQELHAQDGWCTFTTDRDSLSAVDYVVASGIFNVKLDHDPESWRAYVLETLQTLDALSRDGFAINMLSTYSDPAKRRPDLFYGDPLFFFDHCKRRFSPQVALLHDYPLFEFTLIVRK